MIKVFLLCILLFTFFSCSISEGYYIQYSVLGSSGSARVVYLINDNNYEEIVSLPWETSFFINKDQLVGLDVLNLSNGVIDVRIFFTGNGDKQLYKRKIDENHVTIKGIINSIL